MLGVVRSRIIGSLCLPLLLLLPVRALGQEQTPEVPSAHARPTSGEASLHSGRTLGVGETIVGGGLGWPGIYAIVEHGLTSSFNLGARVSLDYGSPLMALEPGAGAELGGPLRVYLFGEGAVDFAAYLEPVISFGEGAAMGEIGSVYRHDFGWSSRLEFGGLIGIRPQERLTLLFGAGGYVGFTHVPAAGDLSPLGAALAKFGVEGLISRDTMLFFLAEGGAGFADDRGSGARVFDQGLISPVLRLTFGIAYLL